MKNIINKNLKKAILKGNRLRNIYRKTKSGDDLHPYKLQRNLVTNINKQSKENHFREAVKCSNCNRKNF